MHERTTTMTRVVKKKVGGVGKKKGVPLVERPLQQCNGIRGEG